MPEYPLPKSREIPPPTLTEVVPSPFPYSELDVITNFSFLRGASHPDELCNQAAQLGHRAIGIADINSFAGIVRMHEAATKIGLRFVVGVKLHLTNAPPLIAWPADRTAYARLCRLLTLGKRRTEKGKCELSLEDFLEHSEGVLAAMIAPRQIDDGFTNHLMELRSALRDRFSLAISRLYDTAGDESRFEQLLQLARSTRIAPLATNGVQYHDPGRRPLHDVLTCIREGCTISEAGYRLLSNAESYLKCPEDMHRIFARYPQAIHRQQEIIEQCQFSLDQLRYEYPDELVPAGKTAIQHLGDLTWTGATARYPDGLPERVRETINHELNIIERLKYEPYFLTVHDLVRFARSKEILCQGRGSAANSAVCYCLGVTNVDPSRIDVLFERFVSSARDEPPDIDIDFEHERREEVIQYVYQKYGRERSGMTAEVITYRGRSAVRDVGKALGLGLDVVNQMAKRLDWWDRGTLPEERVKEVGLDPNDRTVRQVLTLSAQLLGFPRHLSQHVGGLVMTRGPLCEIVPIENASMADRTVIEWDKDDIDTLGILKVDVLALGMLTCIAKCLKLVGMEIDQIPAEDPAVYEMVSNADTVGVFQIESRAQMSMLPRLRPNCFYDLVIEVAIVRPGPIQGDMVHPYLRRRDGVERVEFPKEELRKVLGKTLGVPLFQEQAMRIAIECAGFTPEEADRLRRAVTGFRRYGDIESFGQKFVNGMLDRGYKADFAERCFSQIKGFSTYGFPESHAASFALLVYASAWLKCHHPAAFCCALLNSQPMGFYAPAQIVRDAKDHGVAIHPVDVNHSEWDCTLEGDGEQAVRLGLRMIRGFSQQHALRLIAHRNVIKSYSAVEQLNSIVPRHAILRLAEADAFGSVSLSRRQAIWKSVAAQDEISLFDQPITEPSVVLPTMPIQQEVATDYATAGLSLKAHPVKLIREGLIAMQVITAKELTESSHGRWVQVAGLVLVRQRPGTASGIVFETLEDETGVANLIIRPDIYDRYRSAARYAQLVRADGYVERQGKVVHVMVKRMIDLSALLAEYALRSRDFH